MNTALNFGSNTVQDEQEFKAVFRLTMIFAVCKFTTLKMRWEILFMW